jgi:hypothetical protein
MSENTVYHKLTPLPLELRGRDGVRVQKPKEKNLSPFEVAS